MHFLKTYVWLALITLCIHVVHPFAIQTNCCAIKSEALNNSDQELEMEEDELTKECIFQVRHRAGHCYFKTEKSNYFCGYIPAKSHPLTGLDNPPEKL